MYFDQFYLACLAHASYMIGSEGIATVIDPQRDVEIYIEAARSQGLRIQHVIETHLHADFVSGHRELAARTGATIHVGEKAGALYPHQDARDGEEVRFGRVVLRFLETPGHTLESICILATDLDRSPEPFAVFTGDTLFIGDVGRPDLSPDHTPQQLAGLMFDSLHEKLLKLPDSVEVYPAHGAGSLCGRNISQERSSTIGKERKTNYALKPMSRDEFIELLTSELPPRPEYFLRDAEINRGGAAPIQNLAPLKPLTPQEVQQAQTDGAVVLDTRPATLFGAAHVPGAIQIALTGQFASWAGIVIGLDQPIVIVAEEPQQADESRVRLSRVGIEKVVGYLDGGMLAWDKAGLKHEQVPQISVLDLHQQILEHPDSIEILDVRKKLEWEKGNIEGARLKPLDRLRTMLADLDPHKPTAVHCQGGYRSSIATSLLQRAGFTNVMNVTGGFDAWKAQHLPIVDPAQPAHSTAG